MLQWLHENRVGRCHAWALQVAASNGHVEVAEWLFEHYESTILASDPCGRNAPKTHHGNALVRMFGALSGRKPSILGADKAICDAAAHGHLAIVQMLFDAPKSVWQGSPRILEKKVIPIPQVQEIRTFADAMERAAANGRLEVVQWLYRQGFRTVDAMSGAARNGHFHVIEWLHRNKTICTSSTMDAAAERNNLSIVEWLHTNRRKAVRQNRRLYNERNGRSCRQWHLHIVRWLHDNRLEGCTKNAMDRAAEGGHLHVVQWLHENRSEGCTFKAMDYAARCGHLAVVQWLHKNRHEGCTADAPNLAAAHGYVDLLKWMCANRVESCKPDVIELAASIGRLAVVKWLHGRFPGGFPALRTDPTFFLIYHATVVNFDLIEWFLDIYPAQMTEESAVYCLQSALQFPKPPIFSERVVSLESEYVP